MDETPADIGSENAGDKPSGEIPAGLVPKTPRRGRPPGSRNRTTPIDTGSRAENSTGGGADIDRLEAAKFIGTGFVALVELAESFVHSSCATKIERRFPHKLVEFKEIAAKLGLQEKDKEIMADCATKIASKYNFLTAHGPEIVLGVMMIQYTLRQASLIKFVDSVAKQAAAPITAQPADAPTAVKPAA